MKNYRNHKGEFITKRQHEARLLRKLYVALTGLCIAVVFGIVGSATHTVEYHAPHAEASAPVPDWDICGLNAVICDVEASLEAKVTEVPHNSPITSDRIRTVYRMAEEAGVSGDVLMHVAWCESMLWNAQSGSRYTFDSPRRGIVEGEQERSYGWFMIHTPDHKVTPEQAYDISFATAWAIKQIKNGNYPWYGYAKDTDRCANPVDEYWD